MKSSRPYEKLDLFPYGRREATSYWQKRIALFLFLDILRLKRGLLLEIIAEAGLTRDEFLGLFS